MSEGNSTQSFGSVAVAGASGTIGRVVVRECVRRGYAVTALVRSEAAADLPELAGSEIRVVDLGDPTDVAHAMAAIRPDTLISCIASRSGSPKDAKAVDLDANMHLLIAGGAAGVGQFILLSAICVQRPRLAFQRAKLAFEAALIEASINHTIIRPTAFFKSLSGQVKRVREGKPFLVFGGGELTRCKPISDTDLARFIVDSVGNKERFDAVLPIGGPGPAISLKEQGEILCETAGQEPRFRSISPSLFKVASGFLSLGAPFSSRIAEKAEYARIAHYYATESMLVFNPKTGQYDADATPEFGTETLREHYRKMMAEASNREGAYA